MTARILVTGSSGFIGSVLVNRLRGAGFEVRAGTRRPRADGIACDLDVPDQVRTALAGVDLVVHAAYGDSTAMAAQCATLLAAMAAAGVNRLIHFSSIAVHGDAAGVIDETAPVLVPNDAYGAAKIACEELARNWAAQGHGTRRAIILRPGIVYGAGSPFWIDKLGERIRRGVWGTFGPDGEGLAALVHVDDVADLVADAAVRMTGADVAAMPDVVTAHVIGPDTPSWNGYFAALATALGRGTLPVLDPAAVKRRQALALPAKIWRKLGLPGGAGAALAATPGEIALFRRKAEYTTTIAQDALGYRPHVSLAEGLRRSVPQPKS